MHIFLALLFPAFAAVGFNQILDTLRLIWRKNRVDAELLEAQFTCYMKRMWAQRWPIAIYSIMYLVIFMAMFTIGIIAENALFVSVGGLSITAYVWVVGMAIHAIVHIRQRIDNHNRDSLALMPDEMIRWLEGLNILERPFRLMATDAASQKKLLDKIEQGYIYAMIVTLSYTFWLSIFPDVKVWTLTIILFSGIMLWVLLAYLLGTDNMKPLRALKLIITLMVFKLIELSLVMGLFPNFSNTWESRIKPMAEQRLTDWVSDLFTAKAAEAAPTPTPPPSTISTTVPPTVPIAPSGGSSSRVVTVSNSVNSGDSSPSVSSSKKRRGHGDYLDAHMRQICADFPDLANCKLLIKEEATPVTPPATTLPPAMQPTITPATGEALTPFGLPPVKQLP